MDVKSMVAKTGTADPIGMLATAVIGILSLFGVFTQLGWSTDQLGAFLGFVGLLITAGRTMYNMRKVAPLEDTK
jgi:hypothetical protein